MNFNSRFHCIALVVLGLVIGLLTQSMVGRSTAQVAGNPEKMARDGANRAIGRYQIYTAQSSSGANMREDDRIFMLDTSTGLCWEMSTRNATWADVTPNDIKFSRSAPR